MIDHVALTRQSRLTAIETRYAGCRFRSRLEARWAVALDHLGIAWEHEPDGFETSAGRYLPDFRVRVPQVKNGPHHYQWLEVKPDGAPLDPRHTELAAASDTPVIVVRGLPRSYCDQMRANRPGHNPITVHWPNRTTQPAAFHGGDHLTVDRRAYYCALGDNRHWCQEHFADSLDGEAHLALHDPPHHAPTFSPRVDAALTAARSARFEATR